MNVRRRVRNMRINHLTDTETIAEALASGKLLTANQAAKAVGVNGGTFNYHRRQGRIPSITTENGVSYVYLRDAQVFAEKLAAWRSSRSFERFTEDFFDDESTSTSA